MNSSRNLRQTTLLSAMTALLLATATTVALTAQEGSGAKSGSPAQDPAAGAKTAMDFTTTSRLVGAPVFLEASAEKTADALRDGAQVDRPKAKVTEWLIDGRDGRLCYAVVSIGGFLSIGDKTVLVAADELRWNNAMERYDLGWTKDELRAKPAFDLDAAYKDNLDAACAVPTATDGAAQKAKTAVEAAAQPKTIVGTITSPTSALCKATELASVGVHAGLNVWGKVKDLIVDRGQNRVVLAIVNHGATLGVGGTDYLVAYQNFTMGQNGMDRVLVAEKLTPAQLEGSVQFEKPKNGVVDPAAAKLALEQAKHTKKN